MGSLNDSFTEKFLYLVVNMFSPMNRCRSWLFTYVGLILFLQPHVHRRTIHFLPRFKFINQHILIFLTQFFHFCGEMWRWPLWNFHLDWARFLTQFLGSYTN